LTLEEILCECSLLETSFQLRSGFHCCIEGMHLRTGTVVILLGNIHLTAEKYDRLASPEFLKNQNRLKGDWNFYIASMETGESSLHIWLCYLLHPNVLYTSTHLPHCFHFRSSCFILNALYRHALLSFKAGCQGSL
jgi:hypothetical protein